MQSYNTFFYKVFLILPVFRRSVKTPLVRAAGNLFQVQAVYVVPLGVTVFIQVWQNVWTNMVQIV
jgi:hypothetical protein